MSLYDGYTERRNDENRKKLKKGILVAIIITCILIFILIGLIVYIARQPKTLSLELDEKENSDLLKQLIISTDEEDIVELDEDGKPILYAPIKKVAKTFGYADNNGNYITKSEDTNS